MVSLKIRSIAGDDVLSGVAHGRQVLAALLTSVASATPGQIVLLDFAGVVAATASFLRESILEFRRIVRGSGSNLYPVIANAAPGILDDLQLLLESRSDAMLSCELDNDGNPSQARLIGRLEDKQRLTLELLKKSTEVDAGELAARSSELNAVGITAWNNRLASLVSKGIVKESVRGRSKTFSVLLEH